MGFISDIISTFKLPSLAVTYDSGQSDKTTIILLHGIASSSKTWEPLLPLIDNDQYRVVVLDLLGFGESPKPDNVRYTVDEHVGSIRKTINNLSIHSPYILIGHSMGAIITARYCYKYPKDVSFAVLASLPLYLKKAYAPNMLSHRGTNLLLDSFEFMRKNPNFTISNTKWMSKLFGLTNLVDVSPETWHSFHDSLLNTIENQNTVADIALTTVPMVEIHGSLDHVIIPGNMRQLSRLDNVSVKVISGETHKVSTNFSEQIVLALNEQIGNDQ